MNPKLQGLAQQAAEIFATHIKEKEEEILEAWAGVSAQASEDEKTPVLRLDLCSLTESPSAINAAIRGGLRECAGIRIFQDVEVGVRV
ncbi:MAG: hypothetical protein E6Q97_14985 [Desulfurellales bacterium]|nr:MAG: hypothetical protein E6Q97_14985 [Desulfurellales bacterium]